ncbi:MAG: HEAT repeat domain-containing protein [Rhabdochlamydiaceae bacterium]|nr:HEAT repeat domain-containing protein [Rhabdochlamydiaceae bacterium]
MHRSVLFCATLLTIASQCLSEDSLMFFDQTESGLIPQTISYEREQGINKLHILYLMQGKEIDRSIALYKQYQQFLGRHDFEILQQMALILLDLGTKSSDPEQQLISIYGTQIAGINASIDILESAILSPHPQTQMAAIQSLSHLQDDRSEELLTKAMASDFLFTRMEAAQQLAVRKSRSAVGQIEALMYRIPPQMRFFFPQFFALIGTSDAITVLKQMMDESFHMTRIEAILSAARFGRDDLLPAIRARITHPFVAEQEACASALGMLKDSTSLEALKRLSASPSTNVQLAALKSLYQLGDASAKQQMMTLALAENLFAISACGYLEGTEEDLARLARHSNIQVRFNATVALLQRRDPRCLIPLKEFLLRDVRDLGYQPQFSVGNALMAWKVIPSAIQHQKADGYDLLTLTLNIREHLLRLCVDLPEPIFLNLAREIFDSRQTELIPLLVSLLENVQTQEALALLQDRAQTAGAPLMRAYCTLSLFRLKQPGPHEQAILSWIDSKKQTEMIRFRPMLPWNVRISEKASAFELTPDENSRLLIECYQTFAQKHDEKSIDIILEALSTGHIKNRSVLAGLLIQALQ